MQINWDALGAAGEVLGAAAVVITLLYLVKQLRHAESSSLSSASDRLLRGFDELNRMVVTDASLREVLVKKGELTPSEDEQLYTFAMMYCNIWLTAQTAFDNGQISEVLYRDAAKDVEVELQRWPKIRAPIERWLANYPRVGEYPIFGPVKRGAG